MSKRIYVGNLPFSTNESELREFREAFVELLIRDGRRSVCVVGDVGPLKQASEFQDAVFGGRHRGLYGRGAMMVQ